MFHHVPFMFSFPLCSTMFHSCSHFPYVPPCSVHVLFPLCSTMFHSCSHFPYVPPCCSCSHFPYVPPCSVHVLISPMFHHVPFIFPLCSTMFHSCSHFPYVPPCSFMFSFPLCSTMFHSCSHFPYVPPCSVHPPILPCFTWRSLILHPTMGHCFLSSVTRDRTRILHARSREVASEIEGREQRKWYQLPLVDRLVPLTRLFLLGQV